jgi:hypothetical protein
MLDLFSVDISSFSLAVPEHVAAVLQESRYLYKLRLGD